MKESAVAHFARRFFPRTRGSAVLCGALVVTFTCVLPADPQGPPSASPGGAQSPPAQNAADAQALSDFRQRVDRYVELHQQLEGSLPKLPKEATPREIDRNQRALEALIAKARRAAKPGDIFTPEMQVYVRRLLTRVFDSPEGRQLRSSIMDENPVRIRLRVNQRYPDTVPLSTMPPEVLEALPTLSEEIEYRFIGDQLVLLDPHAHIIIDFITRAMPPRGEGGRDAKPR
jgi:hypothetical protein